MLAGAIVPGFVYGNFLSALLFAIVLSIVGSVFQIFGRSSDNNKENKED
jgi:uncharacterized membrane protein YvlD (DUF360 family)